MFNTKRTKLRIIQRKIFIVINIRRFYGFLVRQTISFSVHCPFFRVNLYLSQVCCVPFWNMCHPETCLRLASCVILKRCTNLKHILHPVSHWNCANSGISKTTCQMCAEAKRSSCTCFFVFSNKNVGLLQIQVVLKDIVVCPRYDKVCTVPI